MKTVNDWLITWTACLLRHPRLFIMIPILSVFLLSYSAVYDITLKPLNGSLLTFLNDCTLVNGLHVSYRDSNWSLESETTASNLTITRVSFAGDNVLRYESLLELFEWINQVPCSTTVVSPLRFLPDNIMTETTKSSDEKRIEKCYLKMINHDLPSRLVSVFFNDIGKRNHVIYMAQQLSVIFLSQETNLALPEWNGISMAPNSQSMITTVHGGHDFISYYNAIARKNASLNWLVYTIGLIQVLLLTVSVLKVYLSIFNSHKVKSSIGLVIGWLNSILISGFVSLALESRVNHSPKWPDAPYPINLLVFGYYSLTVLILSSRNIFRTVNDLAGDSSFGEPESLHKRLIKFYLGFNSSVANSEGLFHVSCFIRRMMRLDTYYYMAPIPNTTIILLINIAGLSTTMGFCALVVRFFVNSFVWAAFCEIFLKYLRLTIITLIVDHFLQLTYMVAIIVIDLHRIDLTDVLAKATIENDLELPNLHEVNPLSARLLEHKSDGKYSWNHKLGTYLLKVSPHSPKYLWLKIIPLLCMCASVTIAIHTHLVEKGHINEFLNFFKSSTIIADEIDALYFFELFTVITIIIAISEITFRLKFSEAQKQNLNSVVILGQTEMQFSDLSHIDSTRKFEAITLDECNSSDKLGLFANPKAPFLVTTDLDHYISLWSPLEKNQEIGVVDISTEFENNIVAQKKSQEFWPVNHVEISNEGDYIMLINNRNCRIKCYSKNEQKYVWEISLTSELSQAQRKMKPVLCFFRKKTVAGFFARELLLRRKKLSGGSKRGSDASLCTMHGNYPPPLMTGTFNNSSSAKNNPAREYEDAFNREEFVMILETGEMITISCDSVKVKVYNLLAEVFSDEPSSADLKILSLKFLITARVNDRVICSISNDEIVIGSAVNNIWRFSKLKTNKYFVSNSLINFAPPLMTRGTWLPSEKHSKSHIFSENMYRQGNTEAHRDVDYGLDKFGSMNESTIVTIDFVGMFVRVRNLQAELIDIQTGTVLRLFHIGTFKPGTFRVSHSEPTHCKFCGCVSFESVSLIYEDLYDRTLIVHTFQLENKKSRNNICLRVERDPLEIRCLGFDAAVEKQYWFDNIEKWELTDMNVIVGIKKVMSDEQQLDDSGDRSFDIDKSNDDVCLSSLRNRKSTKQPHRGQDKLHIFSNQWQGIVVTALNGKILEYDIPMRDLLDKNGYFMRPTLITKFGFKAVAIAFGCVVKIVYLGNDKLIENDLYYSGSASTISPLLNSSSDGGKHLNELLFINKRRRTIERRFARSNDYKT